MNLHNRCNQNLYQANSDPTNSKEQENLQQMQNQNNSGHWTDQENLKYIAFLCKHKVRFSCRLKKRKIRLFQSMSSYIGTRSTIQCRTHHQKFQNKQGSTRAIIQAYKKQIGAQKFKREVKFQSQKRMLWNYKTINTPAVPVRPSVPNLPKEARKQIGVQTENYQQFLTPCNKQTLIEVQENILYLPFFFL